MVEWSNGVTADAIETHRLNCREDMKQTLLRYAALNNHQLSQFAHKSKKPIQAVHVRGTSSNVSDVPAAHSLLRE